jgi:hypothetical protein
MKGGGGGFAASTEAASFAPASLGPVSLGPASLVASLTLASVSGSGEAASADALVAREALGAEALDVLVLVFVLSSFGPVGIGGPPYRVWSRCSRPSHAARLPAPAASATAIIAAFTAVPAERDMSISQNGHRASCAKTWR